MGPYQRLFGARTPSYELPRRLAYVATVGELFGILPLLADFWGIDHLSDKPTTRPGDRQRSISSRSSLGLSPRLGLFDSWKPI